MYELFKNTVSRAECIASIVRITVSNVLEGVWEEMHLVCVLSVTVFFHCIFTFLPSQIFSMQEGGGQVCDINSIECE